MRRRVVCPRSHPASPYLRRLSGAFAKGSQSPPGDDPRNPPMGPRPRIASTCGPRSGRAPGGPEGRFGSRNLLAAGTRPAPIPLPLPPLATVRKFLPPAVSGQHCRSSHARRTGVSESDGRWDLQPVACVLRNQPWRRPEVAWARSSVRAQAILRATLRPQPGARRCPAGAQRAVG